eukprot:gnl/MRDRNA2_/MRDRNA2_71855_c0_seq1.p1 gnl/MRDRNA2_/MRDRNA2_71855_c0~~gnl/MRDRNA2_/MRDRNA2_71855_c0_seq1.p1  ORF type:complete len:178 (-),score=15.31 gnl/MRDRNA2_/MRDRNA2_71855_c0_seq1:34-567(-)
MAYELYEDEIPLTDCGPLTMKFDAICFIIGMVMAATLNVAYMFFLPTEQMRFLYGSGLMVCAVGAEYLGCALMQPSYKHVAAELIVMLTVPTVIILGLAFETPAVAGVWFCHIFYDILHHPRYLKGLAATVGCTKVHVKQAWYPMWCAGVDLVQGFWILYHFAPETLSFNLLPSDSD